MNDERLETSVLPTTEQAKTVETETENPVWRLRDFKGFIHLHSWEGSSCAKDNLINIKSAIAQRTGLSYVGMTEHVGWPGDEYWQKKIEAEFAQIDRLNAEESLPYIFKGIETNIMPEGVLDAGPELLESSDIVVASFHHKNTDTEPVIAQNSVERWCKVMDTYEDISILGHPFRNLPEEEWPKIDWDRVCEKAKEKNIAIELSIPDSAPEKVPEEFISALVRHDNLVVVAPDFHRLSDFFLDGSDFSAEQRAILKEYYKVKSGIADIGFNEGEALKGPGFNKPEYSDEEKAKKRARLQVLRTRLQELEDCAEVAKINEIFSSNVRYNQAETGEVSAEKRKLSYGMLKKYGKRIDQLRRPIDDTGRPRISRDNIVNLWDKEKFANWIKTRKDIADLKKEIDE